jgi:hypothetical protein
MAVVSPLLGTGGVVVTTTTTPFKKKLFFATPLIF